MEISIESKACSYKTFTRNTTFLDRCCVLRADSENDTVSLRQIADPSLHNPSLVRT